MSGNPVIVDALRSPMARGKSGGALSSVHPVELLASLLAAVVERHDLDPGLVDDVIIGCVSQAGEQAATPGRMAVLAAGFPEHVPATTIDRRCGSSQQAIHFAAQGVMAGVYDVVIAGGVESMSRVPMGIARMDKDPFGPAVKARYEPGLIPQGVAAELIAKRWGISREEMDSFSQRSHLRAAAARDSGAFSNEIVPIETSNGRFAADETIRPETTMARLAQLEAVFAAPAFRERFPDIDWSITAGSSSQLTDGASVLLIASEAAARRLNLNPMARFASFDVYGDSPLFMLAAPIPSTRRVLEKAGIGIQDLSHIEINEAFASVPLAWNREFEAESELLNPCGGAIALGHPLGASGARLMTTMVHSLQRNGGRYGLQSMCEAGGMANSTVIERL